MKLRMRKEEKFLEKKREGNKVKFNVRHGQLAGMAGLSVICLFFFSYLPMFGLILAVKDGNKSLNILQAMLQSEWTLQNFVDLVVDEKFWSVLWNTVGLNLLSLLFNFPAPLIFALLINEVRSKHVRKAVQTVANFPHFISWVIFGGIVLALTDMTTGVINPVLEAFGLSSPENPVDLNMPQYFWTKMIIVTVIKNIGWGSIIYTAAIAGISPEIYDAAAIDGAGRWTRAVRITIPMIAPTITIFLLLNISRILGNSFEQFYVFQNSANLSKSEVLATYIYSTGFTYRNYSTAAAMSFFEGVISVALLSMGNFISNRLTGRGLF